jgi:hypothetical protein
MFDVYLNKRRDLLVVRNGSPIPVTEASGRWRKRKRGKLTGVSEEIRGAVRKQGYYIRRLKDLKKS